MTTITRSTLVPYSSAQMFDLVNDIENYPQFLPWCPKASIDEQNTNEMKATLHFTKGPLTHSFTTLNRLVPHQRVDMRLINGPFRFLEGTWKFEDKEKGSEIQFELSFEWSHKLLSLAVGPLFQQMAESMVDAFKQRAHDVYA